jgi:hypothetical protein
VIPAGFPSPALITCTAYDGELDAHVFEVGPVTVAQGTAGEILALADDWEFHSAQAWAVVAPELMAS